MKLRFRFLWSTLNFFWYSPGINSALRDRRQRIEERSAAGVIDVEL